MISFWVCMVNCSGTTTRYCVSGCSMDSLIAVSYRYLVFPEPAPPNMNCNATFSLSFILMGQ